MSEKPKQYRAPDGTLQTWDEKTRDAYATDLGHRVIDLIEDEMYVAFDGYDALPINDVVHGLMSVVCSYAVDGLPDYAEADMLKRYLTEKLSKGIDVSIALVLARTQREADEARQTGKQQ